MIRSPVVFDRVPHEVSIGQSMDGLKDRCLPVSKRCCLQHPRSRRDDESRPPRAALDAHGCMDSRTTGVCQVTRLVASSITSMTKSTNERGQSFHMRFHRATSMTLSDVTARPLCAMGSPEPASMVRSVLSRYICEHVPSLYTSRAAAAREPFRT
eukprot:SAG25_NODE_1887_length_2197_cov_10.718303_3_plen_155_part_00